MTRTPDISPDSSETSVDGSSDALRSELKVAQLRLQAKELEIDKLKKALEKKDDFIALLLKQAYGPTSERRSWESLEPEQQLMLEGMALELPTSPPPPGETTKDSEGKRRKKPTTVSKSGRVRHDANATIVDFDVPNPELEGVSAEELELVETKTIQKVVRVRNPYFIVRVNYNTYRRKGCLEELVPPPLPEVLQDTIYDVSFLADLGIQKYQFHLPIYRQHQIIKNSGILLDRGHLIRILHRLAELLEPIYDCLGSSVLQSSILTVDETPTPAGRKKGKTAKGYFWVFYGEQDEVYFLFSPSRARAVLDSVLEGFQGHLVCDGYSAYKSFVMATEGTTLIQCWGHTRREFLRAEKREPERVKWILRQIRLMYDVEATVKDKPPNKILKARQDETKPLVEELFDFLNTTIAEEIFVPSDPFLKAANYALKRMEPLKAFLENPDIPIDTNHLERELRPQAVGRKNWMFHVTEEGARYAAIFYSLIRSCILCDVNPTTYLVDVLQRIAIHPSSQTDLLIPRKWKEHFADEPMDSPLIEALFVKSVTQF